MNAPPLLPNPPERYEPAYFIALMRTLSTFFREQVSVRDWSVAKLNIDIDTLPTEAALATLRSGDVYRDTTADNVLKVKP